MQYADKKIAVIGLGYVGLPLAVEFGSYRATIGYDINEQRVKELRSGYDNTNELEEDELNRAKYLKITSNSDELADCNIYIVTVPTPIDDSKRPNLHPLREASRSIGQHLQGGDIVIYESTVYPGATEEECVPVLEETSGLAFNKDFFCGYSPERINPGDKFHRLPSITKVTSGSTPEVAQIVDVLYSEIISAGTYKADSIMVAEAAKVIENTQRDLNIALVNELAKLFGELGIDTESVLEAAGTKWNFLPFRPGLVGGHCIGVDPYYLTHKAESIGYRPEIILAGRRMNDGMAEYVASKTIRALVKNKISFTEVRILIMGFTFKENCPDIRNTKVRDLVLELQKYNVIVDVFDPNVDSSIAEHEYGQALISNPHHNAYDAVLLTVGHEQFVKMGSNNIRQFGKPEHVFFDLKSVFPSEESDLRL